MISNIVYKKIPFNYTIGADGERDLTISPDAPPIPWDKFNIMLDLTLNRSMHLPNQRARKIVDLDLSKQRQFLFDSYIKIIERFNSYGKDKITDAFTIYEIQSKTYNVHSHCNVSVCVHTNHENVIAKLRDIAKSIGFLPVGFCIEFIKYPDERRQYLLKPATKYEKPFHLMKTTA